MANKKELFVKINITGKVGKKEIIDAVSHYLSAEVVEIQPSGKLLSLEQLKKHSPENKLTHSEWETRYFYFTAGFNSTLSPVNTEIFHALREIVENLERLWTPEVLKQHEYYQKAKLALQHAEGQK